MINEITAQIQLSPNASWDVNGITVAGLENGTSGSSPSQLNSPMGISISDKNVIYIIDKSNNRIVVVYLDFISTGFVIGSGMGFGLSQFVNLYDCFITNASLYTLDVGQTRVKEFLSDGSNPTVILNLTGTTTAFYFYLDNDLNMYLSNFVTHTVAFVRRNSINSMIVAGNGTSGPNDNQLNLPHGLFVTTIRSIYVADYYNHRIMRWDSGATIGIRVAGSGVAGMGSTQLNYPTQIIVDSNGYMYISELGNARITRWTPNSTFGMCIAACTGIGGVASSQLNVPRSLAFDSHGSLYVSDSGNHRIQKFQILNYQTPSYNQPKFSSCATWHLNAITFADRSTIGTQPYGIFVDTSNIIYFADYGLSRVRIWLAGNMNSIRNITTGLLYPRSIFVTINGDLYVDNGATYHRVDKWTSNANSSVVVMRVSDTCSGLFVDILENIYCSLDSKHSVIKRPFDSNVNVTITIAGNGTLGSASNLLHGPRGIFISTNFSLYVADCYNNRIQLFQQGRSHGTTVAGAGASGAISLLCPTSVILDGDGYLFIADSQQNRIIASSESGFRCILGCTGLAGSTSDTLQQPWTLSFDSHGNLFVTDMLNIRIQQFLLATRSCNESTTTTIGLQTAQTKESTYHIETTLMSTTDIPRTSLSSTHDDPTSLPLVSSSSSHFTSTSCPLNMTKTPCDMLQPCQNDGTCNNANITRNGYLCLCQPGFHGDQCQNDDRPCKPDTCWNNGYCNATSNTTFLCSCIAGWNGIHCQKRVDYFQNMLCLNSGVCRSSLGNYSCECLGGSYSGRHCEITAQQITVYKIISKSFGYVAIIAIVCLVMFVIIMDVLKYYFGIDPARRVVKDLPPKEKNQQAVIIRFTYVDASTPPMSDDPVLPNL